MVWAIFHDRYSRSDTGTPKGAGSRAWYSKTLKAIVDRFSAEAHCSAAIASSSSLPRRTFRPLSCDRPLPSGRHACQPPRRLGCDVVHVMNYSQFVPLISKATSSVQDQPAHAMRMAESVGRMPDRKTTGANRYYYWVQRITFAPFPYLSQHG